MHKVAVVSLVDTFSGVLHSCVPLSLLPLDSLGCGHSLLRGPQVNPFKLAFLWQIILSPVLSMLERAAGVFCIGFNLWVGTVCCCLGDLEPL